MSRFLRLARLLVMSLVVALSGACGQGGNGTAAPSTQPVASAPTSSPIDSVGTSTGTSAPPSKWRIAGGGDTAFGQWSPDGTRLLVIEGKTNAPETDQHVLLARSDGTVDRTITATAAIWVDAGSFLVWRSGRTYVESVADGSETATDPVLPDDAVSNGHGAVAVTAGVRDAQETFSVWTSQGTTTPRRGEPVAWSPDGSTLAVWHFQSRGTDTGAPAIGTLEFLAWPSLSRVSASSEKVDAAPALFDPSGRDVVAPGPTIIDVATGTTTAHAVDFAAHVGNPSELIAWTTSGELVVPSLNGGPASVFDATAAPLFVRSLDGSFDSAAGPLDGSLVVLFAVDPPAQTLTLLRAGVGSTVVLPEGAVIESVSVALKGDMVLVRSRGSTGESVLIASTR